MRSTIASIGLTFLCSPAVAASAPARSMEVRIPSSDGVTLAGMLQMPTGIGRHPVVLIQGGAGPVRRGSYGNLQRRLNDAGIATLSFDKRGVGASTGTFTDTMDDMQADLLAAISWLRKRPEVDGDRIALLGHSQGAAAAPVVAERDGRLAAIVTIAGPIGVRGTMFLSSMRAELMRGGKSPTAADRVTTAARDWFESRETTAATTAIAHARAALVTAFAAADFTPDQAEGAVRSLDTAQVLSMYRAAPGAALSRLRIPVLALIAGRDEHVDATAGATSAALADNAQALVIEVPGAGHVITYRPLNAPPRMTSIGGRDLMPEPVIAGWLREVLHREQGSAPPR